MTENEQRQPTGFSSGRNAFARLTAASTLVLVFAGGLVTSTGSALAVPDWPLSFGQLFPPMVGGVLYEHGHRMIAGTVAILTATLAFWTWKSEERPLVRRLAFVALGAVLLQAALGGLTVLLLLPTGISVAHACLGQVFFCLTTALALVTGRAWLAATPRPAEASTFPGSLAAVTTAVVFLQLFVGALMRHTGAGLAIPDFPLAFGRIVPDLTSTAVAIHFLHRIGAVVVAGFVLWTTLRVLRGHAREPLLARPAFLLTALVALQILLGGLTIWTGRATVPTTAHVATGAAILATSLVLTLRSFHHLEPVRRRAA
ncbi:MAG: COX15/CtaA family protein, partial [Candidatus Binatia bacterium]